MATIQRETRRFFAHLFLSHASLVLVGLELHTELSLTGSLCLWFSVILSLGGFGLTLRALEARFGRLSLTDYHGLYEHSPTLAVCFLLTGLASVGFPGTLGFISTELLVDSAVEASPYVGIAVVAAAALNGIAVVRAYFLLFTGRTARLDGLAGDRPPRADRRADPVGADPRRRPVSPSRESRRGTGPPMKSSRNRTAGPVPVTRGEGDDSTPRRQSSPSLSPFVLTEFLGRARCCSGRNWVRAVETNAGWR